MGNTFYSGGDGLYLSNGGTAAFVDVLMLAVTDLVEEPWDYRFAALLALQDQNVMGRGAVGFDLEDIGWGASPEEQARNKDFVLRVTDPALNRHRWDELDYDPAFVADYLRRFRVMVAAYTLTSRDDGSPMAFPAHEDAAMASCARHRVLSALPYWEGACSARHGSDDTTAQESPSAEDLEVLGPGEQRCPEVVWA